MKYAVDSSPAEKSGTRGKLLRNPYLWYFLIGIVTLTAIRPLLRYEPDPPPVLSELPAFELIDSAGRPLGSAELAGDVYVANFIFTRCVSICPMLTRSMASLQERYKQAGVEGIRLVSFTVDPEYDTPERLGNYAAQHGARPELWTFLTGDPGEIRRVVENGFRLAIESAEFGKDGFVDIAHSGKLVLVDGRGGIRGYYDSDADGIDEVFHRSQHVLKERRR